ncbi:Beta-glucosidase 30 [Frankliniella fusca]|uniref:beta-glucosidase n=1 Tax=Frankliniella fusca TaxID=407009 RepID=A0AAE1HK60_9NEOP|nr:Beta-glucosidase 30 [Frankliniella fusca]
MWAPLVLFGPLVVIARTAEIEDLGTTQVQLPDDLLIGAGVSAAQTEGSWNTGGRSSSVLDYSIHGGGLVQFRRSTWSPDERIPNADIAADSYNRYKEDVAMAAKLKLQVYRFSFSWSRLLPEGNASMPNIEGVRYYHDLIDEIINQGLTPFGTVYQFDHPQSFEEEFDGWQSRKMVHKFREYARFVFNEYNSKIKLWITINEPNILCSFISLISVRARARVAKSTDYFTCIHHLTLAHGEAYRAFKEDKLDGLVGANAWIVPARPKTNSVEDSYAAEVFNQQQVGSVLHPVVFGDYPELVKTTTGHLRPAFSPEERKMLKGATDFLSLNVYIEVFASYKKSNTSEKPPSSGRLKLLKAMMEGPDFVSFEPINSKGEATDFDPLFEVTPDAMRSSLLWAWQRYNLPLFVSENGIGLKKGMNEQLRYAYYSAYLRSLVSTVHEFGVNVLGYCVWSLLDNFEWSNGYEIKYGIVAVDYEGGSLNRSLKHPPDFWLSLAEERVVPFVEVPSS